MSFRKYIIALMKDKRDRPIDIAVKALLQVLSWIYMLGVKTVGAAYFLKLRRVYKIDVPVVSVGNITVGGTGKTPFTIFLANYFRTAGRKPAILIRGYGGDENKMLSIDLSGVPVYTGQDRVKNARVASRAGCDVLILDDGFQHRRIDRDLNILMLDSSTIFSNEHLLPRGVLREPLSALKRADLFVLTKIDMSDAKHKEDIIRNLKEIAPEIPVISVKHKPVSLMGSSGAIHSLENLNGKNVCLVSGIGDPDYFAFLIESLGAKVVSRIDYEDHHPYSPEDIRNICAKYADSGAIEIITTKKDYVKIKELDLSEIKDKLFVMDIEINVAHGEECLVDGLNSIISG